MCTVARGRRRPVPEEVPTVDENALPFLLLLLFFGRISTTFQREK
jgi:hypothetical protein